MKYFVFFLFLIGFAGIIQMSYAEEILMYLENDVRKIYYTGENINSAFFDHDSASVIFELGENATLNLKAPQVYKIGGGLFVLINGEEVSANITTDDCFYYTSFETKTPEKLEIIFAHWAEATERTDDCEIFVVSPLKQVKLGLKAEDIRCNNDLQLIFKATNDHPACVKEQSIPKLVEREWVSLPRTIMTDNAEISIHYWMGGGSISSAAAYRVPPNKDFKPGPGIIGPDPTNGLFDFIFSLQTIKDGKLVVTIPREITGSIAGEETILRDGEEIDYHEIISPSTRTLIIDFTNGTNEIEILGSGYYKDLPPYSSTQN